jgi:hypothetical protein
LSLSVGDATLSFLADTTQLDQAFVRIPEQADASMSATAASVGKLNFELDATGSNAAYAGGMIKESMNEATGAMAVGQNGAVKLGEVVDLAGHKVKESMYQAKGELGVLGEMFGVHLPRHIRSLIAELPGVGAALSAAFAATAVIFIIVKIVELIEKHELLVKAMDKAALAAENLAIKERDHTKSMELANLKLDDQIAKLEGRPERNKLKEALLQTSIAADQLASAFAKDFEKMDEEIEKTQSFTGRLKNDMESWGALLLTLGRLNFMGRFAGDTALLAKQFHDVYKGTEETGAALENVHQRMVAINRLRAEKAGPTEAEQIAAVNTLKVAYQGLGTELEHAQAVIKATGGDNKAVLEEITNRIISTTAAQRDADLEIENIEKEAIIARKENASNAATIAEKDAKHALTVQLANIDAWKAAQHAALESGKIDLAQWLAAEVHASDAAEIAHEHYLQRVVELSKQAGDATKIQAAQEALVAFQTKAVADETDKLAAAMDKHRAATRKVIAEYEKLVGIDVAGINKEFNKATIAAEKLTKAEEELAKAQAKLDEAGVKHTFQDQEEAIKQLAAFHLITEEQKAHKLEILYQQESTAAVNILKDQLKRQDDAVKEAQTALQAGQSNPFLTDAQVLDLQKELKKAEAAYTTTQAEILRTEDKFAKQIQALDKGRYGESLALAVGYGKQLLAEQLQQNHASLLAKEAELAEAKARGENTKAIQLQIAALQKLEGELQKEVKAVTKSQSAWDVFSADFKKHAKDNETIAQQMGTMISGAAQQMQKAFESALMAAILGGQGIGAALEKATAAILAQLAVQAAVKALYNVAEGLAALANPATAWMASGYFTAAAEYALVAGVAGGSAAALSGGSGGGSGARSNVTSSSNPGGAGQTSSSGGGWNQTVSVTHLAAGGLVTGPTRALIGESGDEAVIPLSDPDAMSRLANALLSPHTLRLASSDPAAIAAHSNKSQGGFDDAAMGKLGDLIGAHLDASGGAGDTHHHHWNVKGMISADNMAKVMDKMSKMVQQNRATLHASNSFRVTRRSQ